MDERVIRRGEIYYIGKTGVTPIGSEQFDGRPAIIVSNNICNKHSTVLQIVYLTSQPRNEQPTHVLIDESTTNLKEPSTALCEQINRVGKERIGDYIGRVPDATMEEIDKALMIQLDLDRYLIPSEEPSKKPSEKETQEESQPLNREITMELEKAKMEAEFYKKQYEVLLNIALSRR